MGGTNAVALDIAASTAGSGPETIVGVSDVPMPPPSPSKRLRRNKRASAGDVTEHAFIWDATNGMRDLNQLIDSFSGWELIRADSVNTSGMISGIGLNNGVLHAYRLE